MVAEEKRTEKRRRGSGGGAPGTKLVQRHLLLDPEALDRLCAVYKTSNVSAAVRTAIDLVLLADDAEKMSEMLADANLEDLYQLPPPLLLQSRPGNTTGKEGDEDPA